MAADVQLGPYARRNERAKALGWRSYGQARYWLPRFGARADGSIDRDQQARTALMLARKIDSSNVPGRNGVGEWVEGHFVGSYFSRWTRDRLNSPDHNPRRHGGSYRHGDWRARLVRAAQDLTQLRRA